MPTQLKGFRKETNSVSHKINNQEKKLNVSLHQNFNPEFQPCLLTPRRSMEQALQDVDKEVHQAICSIHASPYKNGY